MTKTMESLLARSAKMIEIRGKIEDTADQRRSRFFVSWFASKLNQFHIKTQSDESQFISQVFQSDIIISIPDQVFLNPRSLVEQLKLIHTNMDNHYDNIAAVLAKYRSNPSPSDKLLYSTDAILHMDKTYMIVQSRL